MAITAFNFAIKRAPYDTYLRLLVMKEYRHIGKEREALCVIDEAICIDPSNPLLFNERGVVCYQLKRYSEAETAFVTVLRLLEKEPPVRVVE